MKSTALPAAALLTLLTLPLGGCSLYLACDDQGVQRKDPAKPDRDLAPVQPLKVYRDYLLVSADGQFSRTRWEDPWRTCGIYDRKPAGKGSRPLRRGEVSRLLRTGYVEPATAAKPVARKLAPGIYAWNDPEQTLVLFDPGGTEQPENTAETAPPRAAPLEQNAMSRHVEFNMTLPQYEIDTRSQDLGLTRVAKGGSSPGSGQPGTTPSCPPVTVQFPNTFPPVEIQTSKGLEAVLNEVARKLAVGSQLQEIPVKVHGGADQRIQLEGSNHGTPEAGQAIDILATVAEDKLSRPDEPLELLYAEGRLGEDQCVESLRLGFEGDLAQLSQVELRPLTSCGSNDDGSGLKVQVAQSGGDAPGDLPLVPLQQVDSNVLEGNLRGTGPGMPVQCFLLTGTEAAKGRLSFKEETRELAVTETRRRSNGAKPDEPAAAGGQTTERKELSQRIESTRSLEKSQKIRSAQSSEIRVVKVCKNGG